MQNKNADAARKRVTVWDFALIAILICTAVFIIIIQTQRGSGNLYVVVKKNSEIVYSQSLLDTLSETDICIDEEYNIILSVMPDGVKVKSSQCSDKICVNTGKITGAGQSIVCLPAHISVEIKGDNSEADVVVG